MKHWSQHQNGRKDLEKHDGKVRKGRAEVTLEVRFVSIMLCMKNITHWCLLVYGRNRLVIVYRCKWSCVEANRFIKSDAWRSRCACHGITTAAGLVYIIYELRLVVNNNDGNVDVHVHDTNDVFFLTIVSPILRITWDTSCIDLCSSTF